MLLVKMKDFQLLSKGFWLGLIPFQVFHYGLITSSLQITNATVISAGESRRRTEEELRKDAEEKARMSDFPSLTSGLMPASSQSAGTKYYNDISDRKESPMSDAGICG